MKPQGLEFENIVEDILRKGGYSSIQREYKAGKFRFDIIANHPEGDKLFAFEVKFYKSKIIPYTTTLEASYQLANMIISSDQEIFGGVLISSSYIASNVQKEIFDMTGINIWDRDSLYSIISDNIELIERLDELFLDNNQISDDIPFKNNRLENLDTKKEVKKGEFIGKKAESKGAKICQKLNDTKEGEDWRDFEIICIQALKFLFEEDLSLWEEQNNNDDGMNRFDLICRISSKNDFWTSLSRYFNTRYILFEFKNYSKPIKQGQIYTTEKYLFTKALRGVSYIIARKGADPNAIKAAKGALRENGKLLQILDLNEICQMLKMKDNNDDPNDFLANKLDKLLIEIGR